MLVWLLRDFDLLSALLRAAVFSFEALTVGGLLFLLFVLLPLDATPAAEGRARRRVGRAALGLLATQAAATAVNAAVLVGGSGLRLHDIASTYFFRAGELAVAAALLVFLLVQVPGRGALWSALTPASLLLAAAVAMSHAASRMDHRVLLAGLTAAHHAGSAGWLGAMAFLLLELRALRAEPDAELAAASIARRYSMLALASAATVIAAGVGLSLVYVGSWPGVYGTEYGLLVSVKVLLTLAMLALGGGNLLLLRGGRLAANLLAQLRRVSEAEIGLGFTILLAAASLTSQSPAADVPQQDRATAPMIAARLQWVAPRLATPDFGQLSTHVSTMAEAVRGRMYSSSTSDAMDRAWSEYNHHWAGLIVLAAALLALLARTAPPASLGRRVASAWPLLFLALAAFIVLRADPEAWPLGPRGFWESFAEPDALEHRLEAALLAAFAIFEWMVRAGRLRSPAAAYVFPLLCALGGAVLLTHTHSLGDPKNELLADLSHLAIAVLGVLAAWSRWLEVRLGRSRLAAAAAFVWPCCLLLAGLVLLDYRES